jgi:putative ABC transport system substrate-binding protein
MNKITLLLISTCLIGASFFVIKNRFSKKHAQFTIGILQTASHPALDQAREGFVKTLKAKLGSKVDFVIQNAEGSINNAQTIAKSFHANNNINAIFAIATPAAQAIKHLERNKPIFFAAVSDPQAIGLIHEGTNVCGASDLINVHQQISAMRKLLPHVKHVALVFNTGEINSVSCMHQQETELKKAQIAVTQIGINNESQIPTAISRAARIADAIMTPVDNTIASAITIVASLARKAGKPLIVSDNLLVEKGALLASGAANYFVAGQKAAGLALQVLVNGKKPHELPIASSIDARIFINKNVCNELGISIPDEIRNNVVIK